jgi:hypothetical protein
MECPRRKRLSGLATILVGFAAAGFILLRLGGFSCARKGEWVKEAANVDPAPVRAEPMSGRWSGRWQTTGNTMSGELRCVIDKLDDSTFRAKFDADWGDLFTHQSTITLKIRQKTDAWKFDGQENLGLLQGGLYKYDGYVKGDEFFCNYSSDFYDGTFLLKRWTGTTTTSASTRIVTSRPAN